MRPIAHPQSTLRYPLNHILGTEANVRLLRVILLSDIPIGVSELARLAQLQASGVARVCTQLEDLGVIEAVGRGSRNRQYRRATRLSLVGNLMDLFRQERERWSGVLRDLQSVMQNLASGLRAAWIEGPVAKGTDRLGDPIVVGILVEPAGVDDARMTAWQRLLPIQSNYDVAIELRVLTAADLETETKDRLAELEYVRPLLGPPPLDVIGASPATRAGYQPRTKGHRDVELRAREIAAVIADRIGKDPSIVEDARRYIDRRLPSASPGERLELEEWQSILSTMSVPRLRRFLLRDDARAIRLRQSLPFLEVLPPEERQRIFAAAVKRR